MRLQEVSLESFAGIRVGQVEDAKAGTGLTVVLADHAEGMAAGLHIGGGGPAARESGILDPLATAGRIHAAVLGGGSAFGLDAAGGVMRYLEEQGIGVPVRDVRVPLVAQIDLFDLPVGDPLVRPDQAMGRAACERAQEGLNGNFRCGNYGAGCGATIGKYAGIEHAMKSGIGSCVLRHGDLLVGAIVAVNAFGDIYDWRTGRKVAGARGEDGRFYGRGEMVGFFHEAGMAGREAQMAANTTIGIVFTNAPFEKAALCKMAAMAHDGMARAVFPVHTSGDGDSVIALSVPEGEGHARATLDAAGTLAAWAVSEAILRGVREARSAYGLVALRDLR